MEGQTPDEARLTSFLLGELPEAERDALEESLFLNDGAFEQALAAEEELLDAYARGELSTAERERFEALFLSRPRVRERVRFALALAAASDTAAVGASPPRPAPLPARTPDAPRPSLLDALRACSAALRYALVAAALVLSVGFVWLLFERTRAGGEARRLREESASLRERVRELEQQSAAERARNEELLARLGGERTQPAPESARPAEQATREAAPPTGETARATAPPPRAEASRQPPRPSVAAFVLTPGLVRGGGGQTLAVPGGASSVALRLNVEAGAYESYRAVIETPGGREVWQADALAPRGEAVSLPALPARSLPPGDYVLLLQGKRPNGAYEGAADYSFRVVRK